MACLLSQCLNKNIPSSFVNLSFDGVLKTPSFDWWGGGEVKSTPPPIYICENNSKRNKIMHCFGSFEDMGIFHVSKKDQHSA